MNVAGESTNEVFKVFGHGDADSIRFIDKNLDANEVAMLIKNSPQYIGGNQIVQLYSCSTGKKADGFAQKLANILGVKVKAPNMDIFTNIYDDFTITSKVNGEYLIGDWETFYPNK